MNAKYGRKIIEDIDVETDRWGDEDDEFHSYIRFKCHDKWYNMDRTNCCIREEVGNISGLTNFGNGEGLEDYMNQCGFTNKEEAQADILKVILRHLKD